MNEATELSRALAIRHAGARQQIILTFTNRARLDFARTWVAHVRRLNLDNYLIGATDEGALSGLLALSVPCFSMRTNLPGVEWDWGSPSFHALGQHKVELIHKALSWGLELVITDIDALVLREPFAYMGRWRDAGFLTSSDCLGNTTGSDDGGLEDHGCLGQVHAPSRSAPIGVLSRIPLGMLMACFECAATSRACGTTASCCRLNMRLRGSCSASTGTGLQHRVYVLQWCARPAMARFYSSVLCLPASHLECADRVPVCAQPPRARWSTIGCWQCGATRVLHGIRPASTRSRVSACRARPAASLIADSFAATAISSAASCRWPCLQAATLTLCRAWLGGSAAHRTRCTVSYYSRLNSACMHRHACARCAVHLC